MKLTKQSVRISNPYGQTAYSQNHSAEINKNGFPVTGKAKNNK